MPNKTPGEIFYTAYRNRKGARAGSVIMASWIEVLLDFQWAYEAAGRTARDGGTGAECYVAFRTAQGRRVEPGAADPPDLYAWDAAAKVVADRRAA